MVLSPTHERALTDTIAQIARATEDSWAQVTCDNLAPALQHFDGSGAGMVYGSEHMFGAFSDREWADSVRQGVCARPAASVVDSLLVSVLSRDVATASMRYHATVRDSGGGGWSGLILRVYWRTPNGWKVRVGMSSHVPDSGTTR